MPKKFVYVVTAGDYSDYHIVRIFEDKNDAQHFKATSDEYNIEEHELNTDYDLTEQFYYIVYTVDGKIANARPDDFETNRRTTIQRTRGGDFEVRLYARNAMYAKKQAADIIARCRALQAINLPYLYTPCMAHKSWLPIKSRMSLRLPEYDYNTFEIYNENDEWVIIP